VREPLLHACKPNLSVRKPLLHVSHQNLGAAHAAPFCFGAGIMPAGGTMVEKFKGYLVSVAPSSPPRWALARI